MNGRVPSTWLKDTFESSTVMPKQIRASLGMSENWGCKKSMGIKKDPKMEVPYIFWPIF